MKPRLESLMRKSAWLILAVLAGAILTVYGVLAATDREARFTQAEGKTRQVAFFVAQDVAEKFRTYDRALITLAERSRAVGLDGLQVSRAHWQLMLDLLAVTPKTRSMGIADAEGNVLLNTAQHGRQPSSINDRDFFLALKANPNGGPVISAPFDGSFANQTLVALARPLTDATGALQAVVFLTIEPMAFDVMAELPTLSEGGSVAITRADGVNLFRAPPAELVGRNFAGTPLWRTLEDNRPEGIYHPPEGQAADGQGRFLAYRRVMGYPLVVVVGTLTERIEMEWRAAWLRNGAFVGVALLGFALLAYRLQSQVDRMTRFELQMHQKVAQDSRRVEEELRRLATTDPLTGLANRRHFLELAELELKRLRRYGGTLALIMLDADHFKQINDVYGHAAGDEALRHLAVVVGTELRDTDLFGRLGGEEFAVLLPGTTLEAATEVAERLRHAVASQPVVAGPLSLPLTISLGVVSCDPEESIDHSLNRADQALYQSKAAGRNKVTAVALVAK